MNKKRVLFAMLAGFLAMGLVFSACKSDPTDDPTDEIINGLGTDGTKIDSTMLGDKGIKIEGIADAKSGDYVLIWADYKTSWDDVLELIDASGWSVKPTDDDVKYRYMTGDAAVEVLNVILKKMDNDNGGGGNRSL